MKHRLKIMVLELGVMMLGDVDKDGLKEIDYLLGSAGSNEDVCRDLVSGLLVGKADWVVSTCAQMLRAVAILKREV